MQLLEEPGRRGSFAAAAAAAAQHNMPRALLVALGLLSAVISQKRQKKPITRVSDIAPHCVVTDSGIANASWVSVANASTTKGRFRMGVHRGGGISDEVSLKILRTGHWEIRSPEDMARMAGGVSIPTRGRFLDVGANLGFYSLTFAQAGWDVVAVEPMQRNRLAFAVSLCLNPALAPRINRVPAALVQSPEVAAASTCIAKVRKSNFGDGAITCTTGSSSSSSSSSGKACSSELTCERVRAMTLDQVLEQTPATRVDVAKADVEGMECKVFSGGRSLFSLPRRVKLLQVEANTAKTQRCLTEIANQYGYHIVKPKAPRAGDRPADQNWFLVDKTEGSVAPGRLL